MFATVITQVQGFLSKSFWFVSFLPVAFVAMLHLVLVVLTYHDAVTVAYLVSLASDVVRLPLIVLGLVVIAYVLTPLIPLFRGVLDGSLLPVWLHQGLHREHTAQVRQARKTIDDAMQIFSEYGELNSRISELWAARAVGEALNTAEDEPSCAAAEAAIGQLREPVDAVEVPPVALAKNAFDAMIIALQNNSAGLQPTAADAARSARVDAAQTSLQQLLDAAETEARHRWDYLAGRSAMLALNNPQATRIGDTRLLAESYSFDVYAVDFDYLWPRLQTFLKSGDVLADRVAALQDQVNFSVLLLALAFTVPAIWIPLLAISGQSVPLFLGVAAIAAIAVGLLYELVAQSHVALAAAVQTAIDFYRHDVLTKLKQPAPATLSAERTIWTELRGAAQSPGTFDLPYRWPTP